MTNHFYAIPEPDILNGIKAELARLFDGLKETSGAQTVEVLDSFDRRLLNKGWMLLKVRKGYELVDIHTQQRISQVDGDEEKPLRFHGDFPESDLANRLGQVLEMRAVSTLCAIQRQWVQYDLLNGDQKIVARMALEALRLDQTTPPVRRCRLMPVRGYAKSLKRIAKCLEQRGLVREEKTAFLALLERQGLFPATYSSKIRVSLKPEMPPAEAIRCIMGNLVSVMQANLDGIRQDIDSEFLHDFRVAVRRARSLLSQMKGVLDTRTASRLQGWLKTMGAVTGNVRDLDVVLLKENQYTQLVPDSLKPGVTRLFQVLKETRREAWDRMVKSMAGVDFAKALAGLEDFVQAAPGAGSGGSGDADGIGDMAGAAIYKRYRRVVQKGVGISDDTPDEKLHALRIDCKKLRYLLEFFASLFPEAPIHDIIKALKQLQDNLGSFNDLSVQQKFLVQYLRPQPPQAAPDATLAAAIGGLITRLFMARRQVRSQFFGVFDAFYRPEHQMRFKTLFAGSRS